MKRIVRMLCHMRIWKDTRGQDMIEYALLAGFVAVAGAALMPQIASKITTIFSNVDTSLSTSISSST